MSTKQKIEDLRAMADRLLLGDPGAKWLRGLFVELCGALLGEEVQHPDVDSSGQRYAPPATLGSYAAPPVAGLAATAHAIAPPGAPGSPAAPRAPMGARPLGGAAPRGERRRRSGGR